MKKSAVIVPVTVAVALAAASNAYANGRTENSPDTANKSKTNQVYFQKDNPWLGTDRGGVLLANYMTDLMLTPDSHVVLANLGLNEGGYFMSMSDAMERVVKNTEDRKNLTPDERAFLKERYTKELNDANTHPSDENTIDFLNRALSKSRDVFGANILDSRVDGLYSFAEGSWRIVPGMYAYVFPNANGTLIVPMNIETGNKLEKEVKTSQIPSGSNIEGLAKSAEHSKVGKARGPFESSTSRPAAARNTPSGIGRSPYFTEKEPYYNPETVPPYSEKQKSFTETSGVGEATGPFNSHLSSQKPLRNPKKIRREQRKAAEEAATVDLVFGPSADISADYSDVNFGMEFWPFRDKTYGFGIISSVGLGLDQPVSSYSAPIGRGKTYSGDVVNVNRMSLGLSGEVLMGPLVLGGGFDYSMWSNKTTETITYDDPSREPTENVNSKPLSGVYGKFFMGLRENFRNGFGIQEIIGYSLRDNKPSLSVRGTYKLK